MQANQGGQPITFGNGLHTTSSILNIQFDRLEQVHRLGALFTLKVEPIQQRVDVLATRKRQGFGLGRNGLRGRLWCDLGGAGYRVRRWHALLLLGLLFLYQRIRRRGVPRIRCVAHGAGQY
ncbi:hypothetical protein D3C85_1494610 [compost metagenome]